jgi:hypothetical protein
MRAALVLASPLLKWLFSIALPPSHPDGGFGDVRFRRRRTRNSPLVRAIFGISFLLLVVAMLLCRVEGAGSSNAATHPRTVLKWVRTTDGWERPDSWHLDEIKRPALHPAVVAAGQGLLSVLGLVVFHRKESGDNARRDR